MVYYGVTNKHESHLLGLSDYSKGEKMDLSLELRTAIEKQVDGMTQKQMIQVADGISHKYRTQSGQGKRLVTNQEEALIYSIVRMPATYGAVTSALTYALEHTEFRPKSLLDVGAGTGAASWATDAILELEHVTCLERESVMVQTGKNLMKEGSEVLIDAEWVSFDLVGDAIKSKSDLVIASYVLNELSESDRIRVLEKIWNATEGILLIIEPGTPEAFRQLEITRELILQKGGHILAPCPHEGRCKLPKEDWCHFSCRVSRSRLHKLLKEGEVPYEDEKFAYMAFAKFESQHADARILRHPYIEKGRITLEVCTKEGKTVNVVKKRDKDIFKTARKAKCGDAIHF